MSNRNAEVTVDCVIEYENTCSWLVKFDEDHEPVWVSKLSGDLNDDQDKITIRENFAIANGMI